MGINFNNFPENEEFEVDNSEEKNINKPASLNIESMRKDIEDFFKSKGLENIKPIAININEISEIADSLSDLLNHMGNGKETEMLSNLLGAFKNLKPAVESEKNNDTIEKVTDILRGRSENLPLTFGKFPVVISDRLYDEFITELGLVAEKGNKSYHIDDITPLKTLVYHGNFNKDLLINDNTGITIVDIGPAIITAMCSDLGCSDAPVTMSFFRNAETGKFEILVPDYPNCIIDFDKFVNVKEYSDLFDENGNYSFFSEMEYLFAVNMMLYTPKSTTMTIPEFGKVVSNICKFDGEKIYVGKIIANDTDSVKTFKNDYFLDKDANNFDFYIFLKGTVRSILEEESIEKYFSRVDYFNAPIMKNLELKSDGNCCYVEIELVDFLRGDEGFK